MEWVVQKFGGTSLGKAEKIQNVVDIIQAQTKLTDVAVVVSAISVQNKKEGTTSKLLQAADRAIQRQPYEVLLEQIEKMHLQCVEQSIQEESQQQQIKTLIHTELHQNLRPFLAALQVIGEVSIRSEDAILSYGERLSAYLLSAVLKQNGIQAEVVDLSQIIQRPFFTINPEFYQYFKKQIVSKIKASKAKVPVITGFFGAVPKGILESIGRGYTDFTASLTAVALKAQKLQIWKEVDGIFSADPNIVQKAHLLSHITPDEAAELAYFGAEVLHPFTIEQVTQAKIPICIKNTFAPQASGTSIQKTENNLKLEPTAVTCKKGVWVLQITSKRMLNASGFMSKVFNVFDQYSIVIDLVSTTEISISLTVKAQSISAQILQELRSFSTVSLIKGMSILSLVGEGMRSQTGTAGKMFSSLAQAGINLEIISQGASEINISCVIREADSVQAMQTVHQAMLE